MINKFFEKGMTLLELTIVLLVLVALAGLTIPYVSGTGQMARCQATDATMRAVKEAIMGGASGPGFYGDLLGQYPASNATASDFNLTYLLQQGSWPAYNPKTAVGWRGPYLQNGRMPPAGLDPSFSNVFDKNTSSTFSNKVHANITGNVQVMDAWNRPIVLQIPCEKASAAATTCTLKHDYARLVSAGPGNGKIDTRIDYDVTVTAVPDAKDRNDDRVLYLKKPDPYQNGNIPCNQL